jgi:hypothetical protein
MKMMKAEKYPVGFDSKHLLPQIHSVAVYGYPNHTGGPIDVDCDGTGSGCFGWTNFYIVY